MIEKCYIIPVQKQCNCQCKTCITQSRFYDKLRDNLIVDEKFINTLNLLKKRGIKKIEVTGGGEPFLNNDLNVIVEEIKKNIPDSYIKLYTNGNIFKKISGVDELNISVFHHNKVINNFFMGGVNIDLFQKLTYFKKTYPNAKLRLSIQLVKGGIDTKDKLDELVNLTKDYVDSYVVRTLYPNTPNLDNYYVDFEYDNDLVTMERDNSVKDFEGIILWSDGNLYQNWDLKHQRWLYSYLLLKPDSKTYINEIVEMIDKFDFKIIKKTIINNFMEEALALYQEKDLEFLKLINTHLENVAFLFGNDALVLMLDKEVSIEKLLEDTNLLKQQIRQRYSLTHFKKGVITIGEKNSHLNLVHCPDPFPYLFDRDLSLIENMNKNEIDDSSFQLVKKYRSYNI